MSIRPPPPLNQCVYIITLQRYVLKISYLFKFEQKVEARKNFNSSLSETRITAKKQNFPKQSHYLLEIINVDIALFLDSHSISTLSGWKFSFLLHVFKIFHFFELRCTLSTLHLAESSASFLIHALKLYPNLNFVKNSFFVVTFYFL